MKKTEFMRGDVFEFSSAKGLCYGQFLTNKPGNVYRGKVQILRIIDRCWEQRPSSMAEITASPTLYYFQGQLQLELRDKVVAFVGNAPIPADEQGMPVFKMGLPDPQNDWKMSRGVLLRGEQLEVVPQFGPEHVNLSHDHIGQIAGVKRKIERGWRPELDSTVVGISNSVMRDTANNPRLVKKRSGTTSRTHFLYFKSEVEATATAAEIERLGFESMLERLDEGEAWLLLVMECNDLKSSNPDLADTLQALSQAHGGTYDGSESGPLA